MRLLYIEDNPLDADLVQRALAADAQTAAFEVDIATTLGQAREYLQTRAPYDAVLADLNLPDGHGIDLIREIRAQRLPVAVVALTSQGDETVVLSALNAGADDYLPKSADMSQRLPGTLNGALQRFRVDAARHARTLRVLYAEHDAADLDLTRRHFERHASNLQLQGVHDAAAVLARLPTDANEPATFDVLMLDYRLVGTSGLDVLKVVREERGLDLPVVMVTGQGSEDVAAQAMRLGASDYVVKRDNYLVALPSVLESAFHRVHAAREHAALRRSEERLALVLRGSSDASWDFDLLSGERFLSPRLWQMLGYDAAPAEADKAPWRDLLHVDELAALTRRYTDALKGAGDDIDTELSLRHRDGHFVPMRARGFISRDDAGHAVRVSGTCTDLSERKRTEQALREFNAELERRVEQRTAQLAASRDEADRANHAKSEFLSRMSHELRTPMNAILGFAQLLEMDAQLGGSRHEWVREIMGGGRHLLELINDVLDLARVESGKVTVSPEAVDMGPLIDECLALLRPLAEASDVRLLEATRHCDVRVHADRTRLRQVLLNLLSNAVKYNRRQGSVNVVCVAELEATPPAVQVRITDSGPGLTAEEQARLFVPFERLGADERRIEGTGIGLVLSRKLMQVMGGEIGVESRPGSGSTFWIRLPLAAGAEVEIPPPAVAGAAPAPAAAGARRHDVLCIEDNPANLRLIEAIFEHRREIRLLTALAPGLGLELARTHRPALILLDINLPEMDGYAVLQCLRENEATRAIPVLAISANAMPRDIERGKAAGFAGYVTKPIDMARLLGLVDELLAPDVAQARRE